MRKSYYRDKMYDELKKIDRIPRPFEFYTAETLWADDHISKQMLAFHLDDNSEPASRPKAFIDCSVSWLKSRFNIGPGVKIADFGCGPGLYTTRFARLGAEVTGIDFSARLINLGTQMAEQGVVRYTITDEGELVEVYRDGTLCFKPSSLKSWAVNTVRDHDVRGLSVVKFEPFSERK